MTRRNEKQSCLFGQSVPGPTLDAEMRCLARFGGSVCGVDEVGRGPLAGPVVAAAVVLDPASVPAGINDSKKLSPKRRADLAVEIRGRAVAVATAQASAAEIDALNILQASLLAMRRAVLHLSPAPACALVDGNQDPRLAMPTQLLVKGDSRSLSIAAASIIAKEFRDTLMQKLARDFPSYGWETNAGYGTPRHLEALKLVGPSPHHRRSFKPVAACAGE